MFLRAITASLKEMFSRCPKNMRIRANACIAAGSGYFGHEHNDVFADINTNFFSEKGGEGQKSFKIIKVHGKTTTKIGGGGEIFKV
jgi:hypothetical protein